MDRTTVIGLVIMGLILSVFTIFNQPTEEEIQKQQKEVALQDQKEKESEAAKKAKAKVTNVVEKATVGNTLIAKVDENGKHISTGKGLVYTDTITKKDTVITVSQNSTSTSAVNPIAQGELIRLENEKLIIDFSTKGGKVAAVYLKEFESYSDYAKKSRKEKKGKDGATINPLQLFKDGDAVNELEFPMNGKTIKTGKYLFTVKNQTKNSITFSLDLGNGQTIENVYSLNKDAYDIDYTININGLGGEVSPKNILFNWEAAFRRSERLFSEQRRVSTVCFYNKTEGIDYLSEMGDDNADAEEEIDWISYKQSYFSSFLRPENGFDKDGTKFKVKEYKDGHERSWTHIKGFSSQANLNIQDANNASVKMNWFFGPNDYEVLKSYDHNYDDVLNFGWGLFRWINLYAVQPLFNFLASTGMGIGIAILMLTLVLKFILMPIQWKMYTSSAKMRILKPDIDELNAKYPNKEDAMKKQMEMMAMYRESGASPLAGCIPMLIQMPILLAVFRFFPAAFELRQKPFLWAEDLSSYDSIWDFGVNIWPYGDHVSLFTLLMAGTTLVYTWLNSGNMQQPQQPGMPNMKVIMYIFPFMMIFFFNNYSSGLSYYYFISTLVSILIMVMIKYFFVDEEKLKAKMANRKAAAASSPKEKKKSKFQERLEQMQKAQQEQLKNRKK
jgi:YidC/Oxa1 family membrane protein insertase